MRFIRSAVRDTNDIYAGLWPLRMLRLTLGCSVSPIILA